MASRGGTLRSSKPGSVIASLAADPHADQTAGVAPTPFCNTPAKGFGSMLQPSGVACYTLAVRIETPQIAGAGIGASQRVSMLASTGVRVAARGDEDEQPHFQDRSHQAVALRQQRLRHPVVALDHPVEQPRERPRPADGMR
jgi:hypothetical protein